MVTECQQRPVNVSVKQWLADNGIKAKDYYYWLRKCCREACKQMQLPDATPPAEVSLAEFQILVPVPVKPAATDNIVAVIGANGITIEISNGILEPLLCILLQEVHMLEDVPGIRRGVLACRTVDLVKELMDLQ